MTVQTVKLAGKRFVIVPETAYRRLERQAQNAAAQDRGDVAEALRRKRRGPTRPYSELRKKLGLT